MPTDQKDIDRWTGALAGHGGPSPGDPVSAEEARSVAALRAAIKAADAASQSEGAADDIGRTRLLKRLEQEGLLESDSATAKHRSRTWRPWLGAAAAVFVAAIGLRLALPPDTNPEDSGTQVRGVAGAIRVAVENPEIAAEQIETQLRALQLDPQRQPRTDRIIIAVEVDANHLEAFHQWARSRGGRALTPGTYRVLVDRLP